VVTGVRMTAARRLGGDGPVVVVAGPLTGSTLGVLPALRACRPELWVVTELPFGRAPPPEELAEQIARCGRLCIIEEHAAHGGVGAMLSQWVLATGIPLLRYDHLCARGYPSQRYGSQAYHRRDSGLDPDSIRRAILKIAQ